MGYRIDYSSGTANKSEMKTRHGKKKIGRLVMVALCFGALLWPEVRSTLGKVIFPGSDAVTEQAFHEFMDELQEGASVSHALEVFCREIIYHDS